MLHTVTWLSIEYALTCCSKILWGMQAQQLAQESERWASGSREQSTGVQLSPCHQLFCPRPFFVLCENESLEVDYKPPKHPGIQAIHLLSVVDHELKPGLKSSKSDFNWQILPARMMSEASASRHLKDPSWGFQAPPEHRWANVWFFVLVKILLRHMKNNPAKLVKWP